MKRILLVSRHCYLDDSNGAAVSSRDITLLLARLGFAVEVLSGTMLDLAADLDPVSWLAGRGWAAGPAPDQYSWSVDARGIHAGTPRHVRLEDSGVPVTLHLGPTTRPHPPDATECEEFLRLFRAVVRRFRPDVVVGYGGDRAQRLIFAEARSQGASTVFRLHNCSYRTREAFESIDRFVTPSHFAARHYRDALGLDADVLPHPVDRDRILAIDWEPTYLTFVNPSVEKGVFVFARIAEELGKRRPEIPLLVVESRAGETAVVGCGLDLREHANVFLMEHTSDPRHFYRVSRALLMPSLVPETFGRVAAEAMTNGIPVLASDRGALPETLGRSGVVLPLPSRLRPERRLLPTAEEVGPWIEAVLRLWDDPEFEEDLRRRGVREAERWSFEALAPQYKRFFEESSQ